MSLIGFPTEKTLVIEMVLKGQEHRWGEKVMKLIKMAKLYVLHKEMSGSSSSSGLSFRKAMQKVYYSVVSVKWHETFSEISNSHGQFIDL